MLCSTAVFPRAPACPPQTTRVRRRSPAVVSALPPRRVVSARANEPPAAADGLSRPKHAAHRCASVQPPKPSLGAGFLKPAHSIQAELLGVFDHPVFVHSVYAELATLGGQHVTAAALASALADTLTMVAPLHEDDLVARHLMAKRYFQAMTTDFSLAMDALTLWRESITFTPAVQQALRKREQRLRSRHARHLRKSQGL